MEKIKILFVEHDEHDLELIHYELKKGAIVFESAIVQTEHDFEHALISFLPDIILSDYTLPSFDGASALSIKQKTDPALPFILVSSTIGEENAVNLIKSGLTDCVQKDRLYTLVPKFNRALEDANERREKKRMQEQLEFDQTNLNALINNTCDSMWSVDTNFNLITSNQVFDDLLLLITGKVIQKGDSILSVAFITPHISKDKQFYERAFTGETFTKVVHNPNHPAFWCEISFFPIKKGALVIGTACSCRDISERKKAETQIRNFATYLNNVLEEERANLAREIHDEIGQQLAGIKMGLSIIKKNNKEEKYINELMNETDNTIQSLRKIATELRPGILDSLGIIPSIQWLATEFEKKTSVECIVELNVQEQLEPVSKKISICFFRICQEALTNITKHAEAKEVRIWITQNNHEFILKIADDGKGIVTEKLENPFSMGLLGMRERAKLINANLNITSEKGEGTTIQLQVKLNQHTA